MTKTIIVPLDESRGSEAAIPIAEQLASMIDGKLLLTSIAELPSEVAAWLETEEAVQDWVDSHFELSEKLDQIAASIQGVTVEQSMSAGNPVTEILATAESVEDPIIVMASSGRSGIERLAVGSVTAGVVHEAPCPVIVIRRPDEGETVPDRDLHRLVVALDGSEFAEQALDAALAMLGHNPLHLLLLRVVETATWYGSKYAEAHRVDHEPFINREGEEADDYLNTMAASIAQDRHQVDWKLAHGVVSQEIREAAEQHNAGLIVMSTHGRTGLSRALLGSVADSVLREAEMPVMLVRPTRD